MKNLKKLFLSSILALGLVTVAVPPAHAQVNEPGVVQTNDDGFDWGRLGLLGLAGLAGLAGRNRRDRDAR